MPRPKFGIDAHGRSLHSMRCSMLSAEMRDDRQQELVYANGSQTDLPIGLLPGGYMRPYQKYDVMTAKILLIDLWISTRLDPDSVARLDTARQEEDAIDRLRDNLDLGSLNL
jgi:hypothetical protein